MSSSSSNNNDNDLLAVLGDDLMVRIVEYLVPEEASVICKQFLTAVEKAAKAALFLLEGKNCVDEDFWLRIQQHVVNAAARPGPPPRPPPDNDNHRRPISLSTLLKAQPPLPTRIALKATRLIPTRQFATGSRWP
jgi:hypothetical protein